MRAKKTFPIGQGSAMDASYQAQKYASQFSKPWEHRSNGTPLLWVRHCPVVKGYVIEPNHNFMPANPAWKDLEAFERGNETQ